MPSPEVTPGGADGVIAVIPTASVDPETPER